MYCQVMLHRFSHPATSDRRSVSVGVLLFAGGRSQTWSCSSSPGSTAAGFHAMMWTCTFCARYVYFTVVWNLHVVVVCGL